MAERLPLILLPGMGADRRMFLAQRAAIPELIVPDWIDPLPKESLPEYAGRLARKIDPGVPCHVGGCSFGGMLALEMTRHLDARACFLISSIRGPHELPGRARLLHPVPGLFPGPLAQLPGLAAGMILKVAAPRLRASRRSTLEQLADHDGRFLRWAGWAVLHWKITPGVPCCPVRQIHGDRDPILPCRLTRPDVVVAGAGHLLPMSHPAEVNRFLLAFPTGAAW